ncbi:MAG: hypothetical protein GF364_08305 [Candidatus Lokiarchaeota archaeon]|nr:hypothetical protein [Candidatus Lokiarchaeota archaeon]
MGRTVPAFRPALDHEISTWEEYRKGLRPPEQDTFDTIMNYARIHADAGSLAARPLLTEVIFMSVILEQQKRIESIEWRIKDLEEKNK